VRWARIWFEAALFLLALVLALLGAVGRFDDAGANSLYFLAWCAALFLLFSLSLRLPLHLKGRYAAAVYTGMVAIAAGIGLLANIGLYRHDAHFDVTATGRYTAPPQLIVAARELDRDVEVSYFYNSQDGEALTAKDVLLGVARRNPHLRVRALDLDKELVTARALGVRTYNSAVIEAEGRRTEIDNTVDLQDVAFGVERVLRRQTPVVCFLTGHAEPYGRTSHAHFSHQEVYARSESTTLEAPDDGVDRLKLAIEALGYADRAVDLSSARGLPAECEVVADIGPRSAYLPEEVEILRSYLARGGRLLLMYDPEFPVTSDFQVVLAKVGIEVGAGMVLDPLNHSGPEEDKVAVPYYPPHLITDRIALTVFPGPRPIRLAAKVPEISAAELVSTSKDSYVRMPATAVAAYTSLHAPVPAPPESPHGPLTLAAALDGNWPDGDRNRFRLVLVGSASFATNAFFPYGSNGELAVSIIRWLAGDVKAPMLRPADYSLPEIRLTSRQMRATFLVVEVLLPLSVILAGILVWRQRR
jgi:ABC-2 type transport system permease protein